MQPGDVPATYADIAHSRRMLNFEPKTSLEEGIPRFVAWYKASQISDKTHTMAS